MNQPIALQASFWNRWNEANRESKIAEVSQDQRSVVLSWLSALGRTNLDLIDVGCGSGWLSPHLKPFGRVTATDLSEAVLGRARERIPNVEFVAGDFMTLDFGRERFDVVVSLEVLSHVADQQAFVAKLASLLRPGGLLMLATQNRPILERYNTVPTPEPGQLRKWFDRNELVSLLSPHFQVREVRAITPVANRGPMRLLAGRKMKRVWRRMVGRAMEKVLTSSGFGWTLMCMAQRR